MNCKPNQLAYLVGNVMVRDSNSSEWVIAVKAGKIVKTVTLEPSENAWVIEEPIPVNMVLPTGAHLKGRLVSIRDDLLKPILPPDNELTEIVEEIRKEMSELSHELV